MRLSTLKNLPYDAPERFLFQKVFFSNLYEQEIFKVLFKGSHWSIFEYSFVTWLSSCGGLIQYCYSENKLVIQSIFVLILRLNYSFVYCINLSGVCYFKNLTEFHLTSFRPNKLPEHLIEKGEVLITNRQQVTLDLFRSLGQFFFTYLFPTEIIKSIKISLQPFLYYLSLKLQKFIHFSDGFKYHLKITCLSVAILFFFSLVKGLFGVNLLIPTTFPAKYIKKLIANSLVTLKVASESLGYACDNKCNLNL